MQIIHDPLGEENPYEYELYERQPHYPMGGDNIKLGILTKPGQQNIMTKKSRDKKDLIIVQEKLDGSNCSVAKINGEIIALGRAGYLAKTSRWEQHKCFALQTTSTPSGSRCSQSASTICCVIRSCICNLRA